MISINDQVKIGVQMYRWAAELFPINRSITGTGVRQTLAYLANLLPGLVIHDAPSGTKAFDWTVPDEWTIRDAYIADESGKRVVDFKQHNLHVVGYSEPVDLWLDREQLEQHLHSLPGQPDAIPYVTSYYKRQWGFCLTHNQRVALPQGLYHVVVDSDLSPGLLNYAELILPGETDEEVLLSTYICHPSMANNELSGPVVTTALAQWLQSIEKRRYTYRILFIPETIGSIVYLSRHSEIMKQKTVAGFVVTCVGDNRAYSFMPTRHGNTLADRVAENILKHHVRDYISYSFLERGSDERQYCSPLIDLPVVSIMRTKYGKYPEYHTSLDDLSLISPEGLDGAFNVIKKCLQALEMNYIYKATTPCEPQLGKRGLYNSSSNEDPGFILNFLAYIDGKLTLLDVANLIHSDILSFTNVVDCLLSNNLISMVPADID
jgi:aminopeptidase-like protein